jgi:hypothetical protein
MITRNQFYDFCKETESSPNNFFSYLSFLQIDWKRLTEEDKEELKTEFKNI